MKFALTLWPIWLTITWYNRYGIQPVVLKLFQSLHTLNKWGFLSPNCPWFHNRNLDKWHCKFIELTSHFVMNQNQITLINAKFTKRKSQCRHAITTWTINMSICRVPPVVSMFPAPHFEQHWTQLTGETNAPMIKTDRQKDHSSTAWLTLTSSH